MDWKVTLYGLSIGEEEITAVTDVLRRRWLSMGEQTEAFEAEFVQMLGGAGEAVAVSSGTAALHTALHALEIGPGDEVLVPSLTFVACAAVVLLNGAKPVFVDSKSLDDFSLDPQDVERKITPRTKAVIAVHYGGYSADMGEIMRIARRHQLRVIEDAAHGPFVHTPWGGIGTIGDIGCYSFFSTKNVTTGEGGMVYSDNPRLVQKARLFRSHYMAASSWSKHAGRSSFYDIEGLGLNYRISDLAAAIGRVQLNKHAAGQAVRVSLAHRYRERLSEPVHLPYRQADPETGSHHIMPILLPQTADRVRLMQQLKEAGIQTSVHYLPCHLFRFYQECLETKPGDCPVAEEIAERQLSLPLHPDLTAAQVDYVCDHLLQNLVK
ncbi:DegT/DnrJ/EryC1/StrS family aminotransferase [Brevibacillus humidisoli]|uniref:DegT/DnrJ/EryC1/StrS family aminotransferase n=1 Tax=Brevibacillus humidisoli TaxID=2895522 RepID=UPI001E4A9099|nr:DegT/DnrJ/EryC1/StrS family aminotransferase [Brevibacillus humidisoli]UFJ42441.1 DegT/DnrJ/EryC1/StrS family aminotransferase [Brevibacillus humidisoli]